MPIHIPFSDAEMCQRRLREAHEEIDRLRELLQDALQYLPEKTEAGYEPGFGPVYKAGGEAVVNLISRIDAALGGEGK